MRAKLVRFASAFLLHIFMALYICWSHYHKFIEICREQRTSEENLPNFSLWEITSTIRKVTLLVTITSKQCPNKLFFKCLLFPCQFQHSNSLLPFNHNLKKIMWLLCYYFCLQEIKKYGLLLVLNPLNRELNPICYLLALLGAHHFIHVSRIRVKSLTFRLLISYIYGAPILDVSRSHTTTQHSR